MSQKAHLTSTRFKSLKYVFQQGPLIQSWSNIKNFDVIKKHWNCEKVLAICKSLYFMNLSSAQRHLYLWFTQHRVRLIFVSFKWLFKTLSVPVQFLSWKMSLISLKVFFSLFPSSMSSKICGPFQYQIHWRISNVFLLFSLSSNLM